MLKFNQFQVPDLEGGYFHTENDQECARCKKWEYEKLSCEKQNQAANNEDCHLHGDNKLDKKCFKKKITSGANFAFVKIPTIGYYPIDMYLRSKNKSS